MDTLDAPDDTAGDVGDRLAGEATLVDHGRFSIDLERAGEQLEAFRVADPALWILLVVEAATLLGADSVRVYCGQRGSILVRILGAVLEPDELRRLSEVGAGLSRSGKTGDAARRDAIACFATALSLLRVRKVDSFVLDTYSSTASSLSWRGSDATSTSSPPARGSSGSGVYLEAEFGEWPRSRTFTAECELLRARCLYARLDVQIDEVPIVRDLCESLRTSNSRWVPRPAPLLLDGELLGYHGFEQDRLRGSRLLLLIHGVLVETLELADEDEPEHGAGYLAIVDSSTLRRDLGLSKIVRDHAFEQILAAVEAARRSWLAAHTYAIQSRQVALAPQPTPELRQATTHADIIVGTVAVVWLGFWLWLWNLTGSGLFGMIGFVGLYFVTAFVFRKAHGARARRLAARAGGGDQ